MWRSGLCTSTPAGGAMSAAVTVPGPCLRRYITTGSSCSLETTSCLMLRISSVTSSFTPGTVVNSCRTPSIRMLVTDAPGMLDSSVRRSELPSVYPKPGSSGSMTNRDRCSPTTSSVSVGLCAMSTVRFPSQGIRHMTPRRTPRPGIGPPGQGPYVLLRVELDDQLLLHRGVDDLAGRQAVHQDPHPVRDDLEPRRNGALAGLGARHDEGRH